MSTKEKELKEFTAAAISVTPRASERIKKSMKIEDKENWGLRMSVEQGGCSGMSYRCPLKKNAVNRIKCLRVVV